MAPELTDRDREPGESDGQDETFDPIHERSGPVDGALDVVDRSIGMYLLRRLTGRSADRPSQRDVAPVVLTADEVAYRIGVAGAQHPVHLDPSAAGGAGAGGRLERASAGRSGGPSAGRPGEPRERLVRDSGVALLAMASVGLAAVIFWPSSPSDPTGQPQGSVFVVNRAVVTPGPTGEVEAATAVATDQPTDPATTEPEPETADPKPAPTSQVNSRATPPPAQPTPRPPAGSTQRPSVTATPRPTASPTPTPSPTPSPTPAPTPEPTPPPTPEPTPPPTPEPTPTPDPTPSP